VTEGRSSTPDHAGPAGTQISSCLGDNCRYSAEPVPVGSSQLRSGGDSGQCGLVGCSRAWWNDRENDHQCKLEWFKRGGRRRLRVGSLAQAVRPLSGAPGSRGPRVLRVALEAELMEPRLELPRLLQVEVEFLQVVTDDALGQPAIERGVDGTAYQPAESRSCECLHQISRVRPADRRRWRPSSPGETAPLRPAGAAGNGSRRRCHPREAAWQTIQT
jgi:hypothetical protein